MIYYYKTYIFKFEFFYSQMLIAEKKPTPPVFSASQHIVSRQDAPIWHGYIGPADDDVVLDGE
jgi:hypothetical protein